jgi:hypothetical protein
MLFFFELFLFVLVMLTLALGEFVSRGLALVLWLVVTVFALLGYLLARQPLGAIAVREAAGPEVTTADAPPERDAPEHDALRAPAAGVIGQAGPAPESTGPSPLDEKWARTLLYNWRRANVLLVLGALAVAGWYWLGV